MKTFTEKVYDVVRGIPEGKTMTYQEVAEKVGSPKAVRAVGTALSKNTDPKNVPCHRVIRSDKGMGGYAFGGVTKKEEILKKEGAI